MTITFQKGDLLHTLEIKPESIGTNGQGYALQFLYIELKKISYDHYQESYTHVTYSLLYTLFIFSPLNPLPNESPITTRKRLRFSVHLIYPPNPSYKDDPSPVDNFLFLRRMVVTLCLGNNIVINSLCSTIKQIWVQILVLPFSTWMTLM